MKKILNNKGFLLSEALVVATVLLTALVILYAQYAKILIKIRGTRNYNTEKAMYAAYQVSDYMAEPDIAEDVINCLDPELGINSKNLTECNIENSNNTAALLSELGIVEAQVALNHYEYNELSIYNDEKWYNYLDYLKNKLSGEARGKANDLLILVKLENEQYGYNLLNLGNLVVE